MPKSLYMVTERFKNSDPVPVYRRFRPEVPDRRESEHDCPARIACLFFRVRHPVNLEAVLIDERDNTALVRQRQRLLHAEGARSPRRYRP